VTFVDRSNAALEVVRANASALGVAEQVTLRRGEALAVLRRLAGEAPFDLVFLDPPYAYAGLPRVLAGLVAARLLAPGARVVAESDRRHPPGPIEGLAAIDERRYGDTLITWYVPAGHEPGETAGSEASDA
jgi:16S rRNA G966 N2-methylase RsmD